ncbi:MAG: hypothetical protein IKM87_07725, partial [Clostridia bacterium]|nr:hypothetical protein [Clostridia bacterium]
ITTTINGLLPPCNTKAPSSSNWTRASDVFYLCLLLLDRFRSIWIRVFFACNSTILNKLSFFFADAGKHGKKEEI